MVTPPESLFEPLILLARLEGHCSMPSLSAIFKRLAYRPNSIGYLSETFQAYGACVPSTLSVPQTQLVCYLSDALFALQSPILITLEAQSTAILKIQLASDRCAPTWQTHFEDLRDHHFHTQNRHPMATTAVKSAGKTVIATSLRRQSFTTVHFFSTK